MTVLLSEDFAGIGTANVAGRTLNNGLGGSASKAWATMTPGLIGDGADGIVNATEGNAQGVVDVSGLDARKYRFKFTPTNTPNLCLIALRNTDNLTTMSGTGVAFLTSHTSLQIRSIVSGSSTTRATTTTTAPGTTFWLELEVDATERNFIGRILNADLSVRDTVTWNSASSGDVSNAGDNVGLGWYFASIPNVGVVDDFVVEDLSAGDTTAPTLTSPTGTQTGSTTATGTVTTDEANGTLYRLASTNATESAATVIAAALSQAVTTTGVQNVSFTGLTASTTYYAHYVHVDAASNQSARVSSSSFTTTTPDTTAPTLSSPTATALSNALIAAGVTTNEANGTLYVVATTSATPPTATQIRAGQDHTGAAAVFADDQVISSTGAKTFNVTGLTQLTLYYLYFHHQDAAGNNSTVSSDSATTFRNGATAQSVIDNTAAIGGNPAGVLYALALTLDPDDWMAYREISAPDPAGGTLTANANGSFTYVGPEPADWVIQPEVNGVDHADGTITVALYQTVTVDEDEPILTSPTGAALGSTGAAGSVSTNEANGTLYWLTTINATETDAAIKAGSSQAVTATGVQYVTSSGLTAETTYYNHFLHRDAAGNDSTRSTSASFTTTAAGVVGDGSRPGEETMHSCMKPAMYPAMNKG